MPVGKHCYLSYGHLRHGEIVWHGYSTFSFLMMDNVLFYLWAKCVTCLRKTNNGNGNIFLGDIEYLVSTLVKYAGHIQVTKSEESGTTFVSTVIATLLYYPPPPDVSGSSLSC